MLICVPKIIKVGGNLTKSSDKKILLVFGGQCRINQINHKQPFTESDKRFTILETQLFFTKIGQSDDMK